MRSHETTTVKPEELSDQVIMSFKWILNKNEILPLAISSSHTATNIFDSSPKRCVHGAAEFALHSVAGVF